MTQSRADKIEAKMVEAAFTITYRIDTKDVEAVKSQAKSLKLKADSVEKGLADPKRTNITFIGTRLLIGNLTVALKNAGIKYSIEFQHQA